MTHKEMFAKNLSQFVSGLAKHVSTDDGQWTIKGFIDIHTNVHTISSDTKVISKILEMQLFSQISRFATQYGYRIELASHQNYYPDITFIKDDESIKFAVDIKTTYRIPNEPLLCRGFTLGSHGEYFKDRTSSKSIQYPYKEYQGHFCLGIIYDRADHQLTDETKAFFITTQMGNIHPTRYVDLPKKHVRDIVVMENLVQIPSVIKNLQFFVAEKWQIASDKGGSGNTENIGSIDNIDDIIHGRGMFSQLGESWFDDYWTEYKGTPSTDNDGKPIKGKNGKLKYKFPTLEEFVTLKGGDVSLIVPRKGTDS